MSDEIRRAHDERRNASKRAHRSPNEGKKKARRERENESRRRHRGNEDNDEADARRLRRNNYDRTHRANEDQDEADARRLKRNNYDEEKKSNCSSFMPTFNTSIEDLRDPSKLDFGSFEQNPETAAVLWHLNRGILQFPMDKTWSKEVVEDMTKSIRNKKLTSEDVNEIIKEYRDTIDPHGDLLTCGVCGIRGYGCVIAEMTTTIHPNQRKYYRMNLDDLSILEYSEENKRKYKKIRRTERKLVY